ADDFAGISDKIASLSSEDLSDAAATSEEFDMDAEMADLEGPEDFEGAGEDNDTDAIAACYRRYRFSSYGYGCGFNYGYGYGFNNYCYTPIYRTHCYTTPVYRPVVYRPVTYNVCHTPVYVSYWGCH
ncbi:MAG: hypothetical protein AAFN70_14775, partial [Planctomycetota bacterium]